MNIDRNAERVVERSLDLSTLCNADQWSGILQRMLCLTKCVDRDRHPVLGLRMPFALGDLQMNREDPVAHNSRWRVILISDHNGRLRLGQRGKENCTQEDGQRATLEASF